MDSFENSYLKDYANLGRSHIGTEEGHRYATRIRSMLKLLPAAAGVAVGSALIAEGNKQNPESLHLKFGGMIPTILKSNSYGKQTLSYHANNQ